MVKDMVFIKYKIIFTKILKVHWFININEELNKPVEFGVLVNNIFIHQLPTMIVLHLSASFFCGVKNEEMCYFLFICLVLKANSRTCDLKVPKKCVK